MPKTDDDRGQQNNGASDHQNLAGPQQFSLYRITQKTGDDARPADCRERSCRFFRIPIHTMSSSANAKTTLRPPPTHGINRANGQENEKNYEAEVISHARGINDSSSEV